MCDVYVLP